MKITACCVFILVFGFSFSACAQAQPVSSAELIGKARQYDGKPVAYEGELVGSVLDRGDFAWLNLHDGENAIGVWVSRLALGGVRLAGGYKTTGDLVSVVGIFHRSCLEHGGGLDIHALELSVLKEGAARPEVLDRIKILYLFILLGALACLLTIHISQKKRKS